MVYRHTQRAPMYWLILAMALVFVLVGCQFDQPLRLPMMIVFHLTGLLMIGLAYSMKTLTVADEGTHLAVRFGPIPLFRHRIDYRTITAVNRARSKWIDGWGIHWGLGRGWTYNLWGFDCVEIQRGDRRERIGTDDAENLLALLQTKISRAPARNGN